MDFYDILDQVITLLKQRGKASYRALQRQFDFDDEYLEDLKVEIIEVQELAIDQGGKMLVWAGKTEGIPESTSQPDPPEPKPVVESSQPTPVETPPAEPYIPEAERRQLTVMFVDIVDSTALSGTLDPEDLRDVVRAYQSACTDVIQRYDGHVAQLLGDGLLVYFGFPSAHEDDAQRAVHAGLGILETISDLNTKLAWDKDIKLAVRLGVHTGLVVIGEMGGEGRQEQLALGETPNVAARIQGLAEPDTVVISSDTYRLIQGFFDCDVLGEHGLRGVSQPIAVYRVLQESGAQSRLDITGTRGFTQLVGRQQEVGLLLERWEQIKDGQGQIVLLSGEAGIGKSRLVQMLKDHVADEAHTRLECRSSPYYTNTAFYPIIDMVQRTLRFRADDAPETKLEKLEQNLSQYNLPLEETVPLFATLLSIPVPEGRYQPLTFSPQRQRQKTLETILAIVLDLAEHQPVLFILEDTHWQDPSTHELLDLLIDQTPTTPLLILITYRPEFQPTWGNRSYLTQVTLNRLSRSQIESIATQVAGGKTLPDEVIEQLVERTDGVPLYVEEMTKTVLESGSLKDVNGQYEVTGSLSTLSIPATLQDSLMARLDRLVTAKAVAQYAAVIGRQFSYELLQTVSELDEATLQRELGRLVEAELVYQRGVIPGATYTFKHALIQDTAYASLLRSTRQSYHRRIAEVLERRFPEMADVQPDLLAHHWTEAGLAERAVGYWQQAGQRAVEHFAYVEAIAHLTKGLEVLKTLPDTNERALRELPLQILLGAALRDSRGYSVPELEPIYTQQQALCQQLGETQQLVSVLWGLRTFYLTRAEFQRAVAVGEQLLALAQQIADPKALLVAYVALGAPLLSLGKITTAHAHLEQGIALYENHRNDFLPFNRGTDEVGTCLNWLSQSLWLLGYPDQALQRMKERLALAEDHPSMFLRALALVIFATRLHQCRREIDAAQQQAEAGHALSVEHGFTSLECQARIKLGWVLAMQGRDEEGLTQIRQGLTDWRATGAELLVPYFLTLMAEGYGTLKQVEAGLDALNEGIEVMAQTGERWYQAEIYCLKGKLLLQQSSDNETEAEESFYQAISIAQNQSAKSWELRAATSLARLWQSQGKREEARELLEPVYDWFTEGFDTADLIDAKALLDELS